jgi:HK97 family phage prohead protease
VDERGAARFNTVHVPAGSATGGQFGTSSGGSSAKPAAKAPAKAPAKAAPAHHMSAAHAAEKARLLAEAHKDAHEAAVLEKTLAGLEKQEQAAVAASKKSAAAAKASLKAGHVVHHRKHAAHHAAHRKHAASLKQRITTIKGQIHALREKAAGLEKQANAIRSGDSGIPGVLPHQLADWWEHGAGAAKIGWGTPGSFDRCVRLAVAEAHIDPERAKGFCAERYHAATGTWPGAHSGNHAGRADMATDTKAGPYGDVTYADPKNGKYPIDTEAHARAAWSYVNMPKNAAMYPMNGVTLSEVKDRIMAACKKFGIDVSDGSDSKNGASRLDPWTVMVLERTYFRTYELEDIHIVRAAQGDSTGRLVEAYAAVWNQPAEIHDHEGHYVEEIDPAAFNKVIADIGRSRAGFGKVKVIYNHGMTIHGTPSERGSMPIATPVEIRPETRGLLTLARYSETPFADEVLENIRNGAITAQSFTGRIVRSDPELRRGDRHRPRNGQLTRVRRTELGLKEFGPTPFEAYSGAEIVGVRMSTPGTWEPDEENDEALPPDEEAAAGEPLARTDGDEHSARYHQHALYALRSKEAREKAGLVW